MDTKSKISFGPYVLDEVNECLWRDDEEIALRPKPYAVLRHLLSNPGVLVTKQQLLQAVWPETFVSDAVLKDSVRQLREALGDDPKEPQFIQTAHRRGYRFIAALEKGTSLTKLDHKVTSPPSSPRFSIYKGIDERPAVPGMLGREQEMAQLHSWLEQALTAQSQCVFVTGEAGIGKTTLVEALLRELSTKDILIGRGQCLEQYGAGEAYLPMLDALSTLSTQSLGSIVVEQLRLRAPSWVVQLPGVFSAEERQSHHDQSFHITRERMLREIAETIEAIATQTPFILVLEDLHWSDFSTLDLISYMARRRNLASFMLIGTYRPVDVILNEHPLKGIKQELSMHRLCHELPLEYLSEESVSDFLNVKFQSNVFPAELAKVLHKQTEGNPLFLVNVVDYLVDLQQIKESDGRHTLSVPVDEIELGVPENIRHLIEKHVERLSEPEQTVLEGASIVGMDCSAVAIAAGLASDVMQIEEICDTLARNHQFLLPAYLAELPDGTITPRYKFMHALYMDVLYKRVAPTRRSQIHARIAERGEAIYGDRVGEIAAELAVHFEEARDLPRAIKYLILAVENAERRSANREALSLARRGVDLLELMPLSNERTVNEKTFTDRISNLTSAANN